LISTAGEIKSITRLHKYAFLISQQDKKIMNEAGFYNDWKASHYGPFSKSLAQDICYLKDNGLKKQKGH